ncbi:hypothetical protein TorRG33x02_039890 [Trema orientale]|uniref:Uncharacterized protein n=1 Tax=Trema orientale TaxID=63057 RepID=A0A2P5FR21_TREOI|nr:hypothetical protein TorRG33x02_039890 [Trema orientale]
MYGGPSKPNHHHHLRHLYQTFMRNSSSELTPSRPRLKVQTKSGTRCSLSTKTTFHEFSVWAEVEIKKETTENDHTTTTTAESRRRACREMTLYSPTWSVNWNKVFLRPNMIFDENFHQRKRNLILVGDYNII